MRAEGAKLVQPEGRKTKGRLITVFIYPVGRRQSQTLLRLAAEGQEAVVTSSSKDIPAS